MKLQNKLLSTILFLYFLLNSPFALAGPRLNEFRVSISKCQTPEAVDSLLKETVLKFKHIRANRQITNKESEYLNNLLCDITILAFSRKNQLINQENKKKSLLELENEIDIASSSNVHLSAESIISRFRPFWSEYIDEKFKLWLMSKNDSIRTFAAGSIGGFHNVPNSFKHTLINLLNDPVWQVRGSALSSLADLRVMEAIPAIINSLDDPVEMVRRNANVALYQFWYFTSEYMASYPEYLSKSKVGVRGLSFCFRGLFLLCLKVGFGHTSGLPSISNDKF
jgi:hypothetical protein